MSEDAPTPDPADRDRPRVPTPPATAPAAHTSPAVEKELAAHHHDGPAASASPGDDPTDPTVTPADAVVAGAKPDKKKPKKKRSWRRRLTIAVVVLIGLAVLFRVALQVAFPIVLTKVAAGLGLDASYDRFTLSLTGGDVGLANLQFVPQGKSEPLAAAGYVRATISPLKLFVGKLEVWRVETDGIIVNVDREADGSMPVVDKLLAAAGVGPGQAAAPPAAAAKPSAGGSKIDLTAPLSVEGFRLQHVEAHLRDKSLTPPLDATVRLDVRVDDIGVPGKRTRFEVAVSSDPILDAVLVKGEGQSAGAALDATLSASVKGLHLKPLAGYLTPLGIRPVADSTTMTMDGRLKTTAAGLVQAVGQVASAAAAATRAAPTVAGKPATPAPAKPAAAAAPAAAPAPADALALELTLTNMAVLTDGREAAAVDTLSINASKLNSTAAVLSWVVFDGVRAGAERTIDGNVRAAGLELFPVAAKPKVPATQPALASGAKPAATPPVAASPAAASSAPPFTAVLGTLGLKNVKLSVDDQFVEPPAKLAFLVDEFTVKDVALDPAKVDAPVKIAGLFRAPGVARVVRLDGTATPFAKTKAVALNVAGEGFSPRAVQPYLDLLGLQSQLEDATFSAALTASATVDPVSGKVGADLRLSNIKFADRKTAAADGSTIVGSAGAPASSPSGGELFALDEVKVAGVSLDPTTGKVRVESIEGTGPSLTIRRDADGWLSGLGFRAKPPVPGRQRDVPPAEPTEFKLARVEVGRLAWKGVKVGFEDRASVPPQTVALGDAGLEISDLTLDLENKDPNVKPGTLKAWLVAPGVADRLEVAGTLTPKVGSLAIDLTAAGRGITAAGVSGYLKSLGIEPLLKDGSVAAHLSANVAQTPTGNLTASLTVDGVKYADGATELAGVDKLTVGPVELNPKENTLSVAAIEVDKPRASVMRDADGTLVAGGIRLLPRTPVAVGASAAAPATRQALAGGLGAPAGLGDAPATGPALATGASGTLPATSPAGTGSLPFVATLKSFRVREAALQWTDRATTRPVATTAHVDLTLDNLTVGKEAAPATLSLTFRADDVLDGLTVKGQAWPGPTWYGTALAVEATGVRGTALAPYLPPGARFTLKDGRFSTTVDAVVEPAPAGGWAARLKVDGVDWRDGPDGPPLLKLADFRVDVPRADPAGNVVAVKEIVLNGLELEAEKAPDGAFAAMGLALGTPVPASSIPAAATQSSAAPLASPRQTAATAPPTAQPGPTAAPLAAPVDVRAVVARARQALPLVTLDKLDLNVKRIGYRDRSAGSALPEPLAVTDLRFRTTDKVELLGPDPMSNPPVKLELTGKADPLVGAIRLTSTVAPFAQQPALVADVELAGIKGDGIFTVAPALRPQIDAAGLRNGRFRTHAEVQLKLDRRGPTDVDFSKGFDAEVLVKGTEFRVDPAGEVVLGLDEARVEEARVKLTPAMNVRVKSVELVKPIARAVREKDGIHAGGLVIRMPAEVTSTRQPASMATRPTTPATPPSTGNPALPTASAPAGPVVAQRPNWEVRVDKFTVSGVDVRVEDRSVEPPVLIPLTALDVEARDISSLAQFEDRPIRFAVSANAGKVILPKKEKLGLIGAAGQIGNVFGGLAGGVTGGSKKDPVTPAVPATFPTEARDLFAQVAASGKLSLYPKPGGYVKANVSGFEVASIGGLAKQKAVELSHGTFDVTADVRGPGDGTFDVNANPSFTDLNVSDPAGFLAKGLDLPAPLDFAIGTAEAADKSLTIPIQGVKVKPSPDGGYSLAGIRDQILPAVTSVFVKAIAAAPVKIIRGADDIVGVSKLGQLIGLGGEKKPDGPTVLAFPPGSTGLEPADLQALAALAQRLKSEPDLTVTIRHDFGGGDARLAEARANPPTADATAIASGLHQRKLELARLRPQLAAEARFRLASGNAAVGSAAVDRLRAVDRDLARTEDALDRAYDLLRPGADRQAPRRTRAAALEIARDRLDAVRQALTDAGVPNLGARMPRTSVQFAPSDDANAGGTITIEAKAKEKK